MSKNRCKYLCNYGVNIFRVFIWKIVSLIRKAAAIREFWNIRCFVEKKWTENIKFVEKEWVWSLDPFGTLRQLGHFCFHFPGLEPYPPEYVPVLKNHYKTKKKVWGLQIDRTSISVWSAWSNTDRCNWQLRELIKNIILH